MTIQQLVAREQRRLISEKAELEQLISDAPSGVLTFVKNISKGKVYYKWYVRSEKAGRQRTRKYLPRREKQYAKDLAIKSMHQARLDDINHELSALNSYLSKHTESSFWKKLISSPEFGKLAFDNEFQTPPDLAEELERWANEKYETNKEHPEQRNIPTDQGIMVRSKSEAIILMLLSMYHIPFRYECRLDVAGRIYYPDFTIRHPITGEIFYWEHVGRLDLPTYRSDFLTKLHTYINNGIMPDHNLILTFESDGHPLDISIVMDKFEEFFFCNKQPLC